MLSHQLKQFLRLQRIAVGLAGLSFGLLLSVFSNWLSEQWINLLPVVMGVALISGVVSIFFFLRQPPLRIEVAIRAPRIIRSPEQARQYARRGFVGFVPIYTPRRDSPAGQISPEEMRQAVETLDFDRLQLEQSNLRPTIEAITSHASQLEHCWLLATQCQQAAGSLPYAHLLAEYLRRSKGLKCKFHYGAAYVISLDDDALVLSQTYDQIQQVLRQAARLELAPRDLVADITTGFRSMTLGMILASLDRDQDVEFVGTRYDERGQPTAALFPIIFSFEPNLEAK